jgi:phosphatidylserine/phosphatidylglycerophosphate/cardiolipin synthase-like enzyme
MALCSYFNEGRLFITAPYYDETFIEVMSKHLQMRSSTFEVIVKNESIAQKVAASFRQHGAKNVQLYISKHIHAKVYVFESRRGDLAAMIGSHNPTRAGMSRNLEIGIVISAKPNKPEWKMISDLRDYLKRKSRFYASLKA